MTGPLVSATRRNRRIVLPILLASALNPVNSSIIAVSLVPIGRALKVPTSQTVWLVSVLYLSTAIGQPVVGRLVDVYGPKSMLIAGAVLTGAAGVLGSLAPNLAVLVVARAVLGLGTCAGYPAAMHLIRARSQDPAAPRPSGLLTALAVTVQTIAVVGPSLGGLLIAVWGWRATLAVNVPLAAASLLLVLAFVPNAASIPPDSHAGSDRVRRSASWLSMDWVGIGSFCAMLTTFMLFIMDASVVNLRLLLTAVVCGIAFSWRELRFQKAAPFIDLRVLIGNTPLVATYARTFLTYTVSYSFLYGFTQWLQNSAQLTPTHAGLLLVPMSLVAIALTATTGRSPRLKRKLIVGTTCQLLGCILIVSLHAGSPRWQLIGVAALYGVPQGLNGLANQNALYLQAYPNRLGSSSGLLRTFTYIGAIVASAANGAFFGATASTAGLHRIALLIAAAALLGLLISAFDRSLTKPPPSPQTGADLAQRAVSGS